MMNVKKWLKVWFSLIFIILLSIGISNFYIDPLLNFNQYNILNNHFKGFDERQQKTNYIENSSLKFDGLLLGSSRTTFINQNDFINMSVFNYASNSMLPGEYKGYIDFFKLRNPNLKYIIIGVDFYGTKIPIDIQQKPPSYYINNSKNNFYKYKMLFSIDSFKQTIGILKQNTTKKRLHYYNRKNIHIQKKVSNSEFERRFKSNLIRHTYEFSNFKYEWDVNYFKRLKELKNENPNTNFIIFTSPISADLFVSIIKNTNKWNEYEKWIKGLINIFSEIYCFMDVNSITTNLQNYPDDDHFYPYIGKIVANKISLNNFESYPKDFGIKVNNNNVDEFLKEQLEKINNYEYSKFYPKEQINYKLKLD